MDELDVDQDMKTQTQTQKEREMLDSYESMFASRGEVTPTDPLEFHLFHLARYWSRIVGFAKVVGDGCDSLVEGDSGSLVRMATDQAGRVLREADLIPNLWTEYVDQLETMLTLRPVSVKVIERASDEFDKCLEAIGYDPWLDSETSNTKANKSRHSNPYQPPCSHDLP